MEPAQDHVGWEWAVLALHAFDLLLDDAVRLSEALSFPWQLDGGVRLLSQQLLEDIALHGQEDTARVVVEAGNIIIADKVLRTIVSPDAE